MSPLLIKPPNYFEILGVTCNWLLVIDRPNQTQYIIAETKLVVVLAFMEW